MMYFCKAFAAPSCHRIATAHRIIGAIIGPRTAAQHAEQATTTGDRADALTAPNE